MVHGESKQLDKLIGHKDIINHMKAKQINLVWLFTSKAGRENGKKKYKIGNRC
jgi:hypothetical protein